MKEFRPPLHLVGGDGAVMLADGEQFRLWLAKAKPGDRMIYARAIWLPRHTEGSVSQLVRDAADAGLVITFQRTLAAPPVGPGGKEYIVHRRAQVLRPAVRFTPRDRAGALFGGRR